MKTAEEPFRFLTASYLTRIGNQRATNLHELREGLEQSSDGSIFYHTFQTLGLHHFLTEGFSNDFAQWVLASTNRVELAEQLAGLDIRDYLSLAELRADLQRVMAEYCDSHPSESTQTAFEPFYFREGIEITVPLGREARTLAEFRDGLASLGHASLQFHFIASRLRLQLRTNDFSHWLAAGLGLEGLARQMNRIDIYTNTLDGIQERLLALVERELAA
jgi:hypothetical protein